MLSTVNSRANTGPIGSVRIAGSSHISRRPGSKGSVRVAGSINRRPVRTQDVVVLYPDNSSATLPRPTNVEMAISNFHVEFDNESGRFKPGDELCGKVIMDIWASIEVRFVEFVIQGKGTLRVFKDTSTFIERPKHEIYVDKKIILIGPQHGYTTTQLDPGRYVSDFSYLLPEDIPPTVHQFDLGNGYIFDISYCVAAHVCDNVRSKYLHNAGQLVRIIKATKQIFNITPQHDWQSIPGALEPVIHAEQLLLFCSPMNSDPTSVFLNMDRGVYPIGDTINLHIEVVMKKLGRIKEVRAELEQQMLFSGDLIQKWRRVLIKAFDDRRQHKISQRPGGNCIQRSSFSMPVPPNLVPSFLPHCHLLGITYSMKVTIRFRSLGGKLVIRLPIVVAPASEPERNIDNPLMPVFNKPIMQFPYFSKSPYVNGKDTSTASDSDSLGTRSTDYKHNPEIKHDRVATKYKTCMNCCSCCLGCLGFGIYEQ